MTLLEQLRHRLDVLSARNLRRTRLSTSSPCAPEVVVEGQPWLAFNSNDYLGLAADPRVVAALQEGAARYGAGSGASHLISGHSLAHEQLEERLAELLVDHIDAVRTLYFSTGYMANLAVLTSLVDAAQGDCMVFSEELNHASLIDGIRLSKAPFCVYPHGDLQTLDTQLTSSSARHKIVVTDGVFSMDGDIAPLPELLALCEQHGAWLFVDDAHGFGTLGTQGHGILEHFDLRSPHLVYVGTLGKAAGVSGAFVAAHATVIDWMVQRARPYIYTTAAAPALAHALLTSLDIITSPEGQERRSQLQRHIQRFQNTPLLDHWKRLTSSTAVQPLIIGSNPDVMRAAGALQAQSLWVTAIRAPTVPEGSARLRITFSAAHTDDQVTRLIDALHALRLESLG